MLLSQCDISHGPNGAAANGTGIANYLLTELRRLPILLLLPQDDPAGAEAVCRWMEKMPQAKRIAHAFDEAEKDLNDQVMAYGLETVASVLRDSIRQAVSPSRRRSGPN